MTTPAELIDFMCQKYKISEAKELYQEKKGSVNGRIKIIDPEIIAERASEGLLQLSMELGLSVLSQMMEHVAGKKGTHQKARKAYHHGYEQSRVVMGGE